jgi:hypothetical protein
MTSLSQIRPMIGRPTVPLLGILALVVAGCAQVGGPTLTFWDVIFSLVALYFWFMLIWLFISLFADIFRRQDLSGIAKAGWMLLIIVFPFGGALIYVVARPKDTWSGIPGASIAQASRPNSSEVQKIATADASAMNDLEAQERKRQAADDLMRPPQG